MEIRRNVFLNEGENWPEIKPLPALTFAWAFENLVLGPSVPKAERTHKRCPQCQQTLPLERFSRNGRGYLRSECNKCRVVMNRNYRKKKKLDASLSTV